MKKELLIFIFILVLFLPSFGVEAGVVLSSHKYAWSNNVGYINFENVIIGDSALGGYAWSENTGFINFDPVQSGVLNDGAGNLFGSAWGEQLGYIDFGNVMINPTTGKFSGTATGTLVGTITFDCPSYCDVETDWREAEAEAVATTNSITSGSISRRIINNISNTISEILLPDTGLIIENLSGIISSVIDDAKSTREAKHPEKISVSVTEQNTLSENISPSDSVSEPVQQMWEGFPYFIILLISLAMLIILLLIK